MEFLKLFNWEDVIQKPLVPWACFLFMSYCFSPCFLIICGRAQESSLGRVLMCGAAVTSDGRISGKEIPR